jgi:DNA replication protein DnaC
LSERGQAERGAPLHGGVDPGCRICRGQGYTIATLGELATAQRCTCVHECPACGDTGFVADLSDPRHKVGRARKQRCRCLELDNRIGRYNAAGIPARHAHATRASFKPSTEQRDAFTTVSRWLASYRRNEDTRGIILYGAVGCGKTHLVTAMLTELVFVHGATARFVEFSHLLQDLKSGFERGTAASALLDPLVEVDVLAIDEMGKGRNTEFEGTIVDELTSRRYNAMRTIIGTTNHPPKASTGRSAPNLSNPDPTGEALVDRVGPRVFSRLQEICDFVEVPGQDYRVRIGLGDVEKPSRRPARRV